MALKVERRGGPVTSDNLSTSKPLLCYTCKLRKTGLFGTDPYNKPACADCLRAMNRPID